MANYDLAFPGAAIDAILTTAYDLQNAGYIFKGSATNWSGTPTQRTWLLAPAGFSGYGFSSAIPKGSIGICKYNGSAWSGDLINVVTIDNYPTHDSTNAVTSGGMWQALDDLADGILDTLQSFVIQDGTASANQGTQIKFDVKMTDGQQVQHLISSFEILAATTVKAGLMSAADKAKVDSFLTILRSMTFADTTAGADVGTQIVETLKMTVGGVQEAVAALTILAATTSKAGLMSAADKTYLDGIPSSLSTISASISNLLAMLGYYECSTAAGTAAKTVSASGYVLTNGGCIRIKMTNANTANNVTLNINGTGAKNLYYDGAQASSSNSWDAGDILEVFYDGTQYQCASGGGGKFATGEKVKETSITDEITSNSDALPTSGAVAEETDNLKANIGYFTCDTAAATAAKVVSATGYKLTTGGNIRIKMTNANTAANATLNINSTGAKALYYDGAQASSSNSWDAGEVLEVFYDGTQYQCASGGGGKFATGEKVKETSITDEITPNSDDLPTSGAVAEEIDNLKANIGYFICDTMAGIAEKIVSASGYSLTTGGNIRIKMTNPTTAEQTTLNINSTGAYPLFYNGKQSNGSNSWIPGEVIVVYFDGNYYQSFNAFGQNENINLKSYGNSNIDYYTQQTGYVPCIFHPENTAFLKKIVFNRTQLGNDLNQQVTVGFAIYNSDLTKNTYFYAVKEAGSNEVYLSGHTVPAGGYMVFDKTTWIRITQDGCATCPDYYVFNITGTNNLRGAGQHFIFPNCSIIYAENTVNVETNADENTVKISEFIGKGRIILNNTNTAFAVSTASNKNEALGNLIPISSFDVTKGIRLGRNSKMSKTHIAFLTNSDLVYGGTIPFCADTALMDTTAWLKIPSDCTWVYILCDGTTRALPDVFQESWDKILGNMKRRSVCIVGDSYSTYENWLPTGYLTYYPHQDVDEVQYTWWHKMCVISGASLFANISYGGATICTTGYEGADNSEKSLIYTTSQHLGAGKVLDPKPDVVFILAGTNDYWAGSPVGEPVRSNWTTDDLKSSIPAFDYIIYNLKKYNPGVEIIVLLNTMIYGNTDLESGLITECEYWEVKYHKLDLFPLDVQKHPFKTAMELIAYTAAGYAEGYY